MTKFTLYYDLGQTGTFESVDLPDTFQRTYTLSGQTTGTIVDFQITAWNINYESTRSNVLTVYIADEPNAPLIPIETLISEIENSDE